jgi:hypothetical protein
VAWLALTALAVIFYAPSIFAGRTLLLRDLFTQFHGPRWWYQVSLRAGQLPYWNPYIACGDPFLANPQNGVLYPLSLLFLVLPFGAGLTAYAALHSVLLGWFSYLLGRKLGLAFWGALLAGTVAGFAGLPLKQVEFLEMVGGLAWTPLVLLGAWMCLAEPRPRWAAVLGAALGLQLLAGSPYPPLYSCLGIACAIVAALAGRILQRGQVEKVDPASRARFLNLTPSLLYLATGVVLGSLIGCAQYLPTLLLARDIPASEMNEIMQPRFSLRLRDLLDFLSPWLAGFPNWQKCFYVGVVPLFFAALAVLPRRRGQVANPDIAPRDVRIGNLTPFALSARLFALSLIVVGWIFAQGDYLGIDRLMDALPLIRRASKWPTIGLSLTVIGLALLAGEGVQRWIDSRRPAGLKAWLGWLGPVGIFGLLLAFDALQGGPWLGQIRDYLKEPMLVFRSPTLAANLPMGPEAIRLAACAAALAALLWLGLSGRKRGLAPAVCLLVAAELYSAGANLNFQSPANLYADPAPPSLVEQLGSHYDVGALRVLVPDTFTHFGDIVYGSQISDDFRILRGLYDQDTVMSWRVYTTQGGGSVHLPAYQYGLQPLLDKLSTLNSPVALRILGAWNIGVILQGGLDNAGLHCDVLRNGYLLPRVRLIERTVTVPDEADALAAIGRGRWDPASVLATWDQHLPEAAGGGDEPGAVAWFEYTPAGVRVACDVRRPCLLVLAENWAEGWSARIDGAPTPVYRVNYLQQAVQVTPGRHEVMFHYVAPGAHWGFLLAGLGLGGIGCCAMSKRGR